MLQNAHFGAGSDALQQIHGAVVKSNFCSSCPPIPSRKQARTLAACGMYPIPFRIFLHKIAKNNSK